MNLAKVAGLPAGAIRGTPPAIDADLLRKYGGNGPRYTSYPTAERFIEAFDAEAYRHWLANRNIGGFSRQLGLYVRVPFGDTGYLAHLGREMRLVAHAMGGDRRIARMHWGGGTPSFLGDEDSRRLMDTVRSHFELAPGADCSIEIDPRRADARRVAHLARLGFNRVSVGVHDFDRDVRLAADRGQSFDDTRAVIVAARAHGFRSVSLDLIHGLAKQAAAGLSRTLDRVLECDPDRIALHSYAHPPEDSEAQRRIVASNLPSPDTKLELMASAIARLGAAGYSHIGMDHFAKASDELAVAQATGRLRLDFQGYAAGGDCDLVGLGVAAIGRIGPTYVQNVRSLDDYEAMLGEGRLPVLRGIELTPDDLLRRAVIHSLACQSIVSKEAMGIAYLVDFDRYFAAELRDLARMEADGLVELEAEYIIVTPAGRLLVRAICAVFDRYLRATEERARYSRVM